MLALADADGVVRASARGLAHTANVPVEDCEAALRTLSEPDPDSRTPDYDGRRIEALEGGWIILNHGRYRDLRTRDQMSAAARKRRQRQRAKERDTSQDTAGQAVTSGEGEEDTEADEEVEGGGDPRQPSVPTALPGESTRTSLPRSLRYVLENRMGGTFDEGNFTYKSAMTLIQGDLATLEEIDAALEAWNSGTRPPGIPKLRMFQQRNWPKVRKACLSSREAGSRSEWERMVQCED